MFRIKNLLRLSITLLLLFPSHALPGDKAEDIVRKVRKTYEQIRTLQVDFQQTIYWALAEEKQQYTGRLYLADKNKYRVESDAQTIVTDGTNVWTFSKDRNQVIINRLAQARENPLPRDLLLQYTKEYRASLKGETDIGGMPCYEVEFTPRKADAFIIRTKAWVMKNNFLVSRIEQEDINENITSYTLSNFKVNPPLPDTTFTFQVPADAEVVDLR